MPFDPTQFGATPVTATPPKPAAGGFDPTALGATPVAPPPAPPINPLGMATDALASVGHQQMEGVRTAVKGVQEGADMAARQDSSLPGEVKKAGALLHGGAQAVVGAGQSVFAPFTAAIMKVIDVAGNNPTVQAVAQSTPVSDFLDKANGTAAEAGHAWDALEQAHPEFARVVKDVAGVAATAAGDKVAPETDIGKAAAGGIKSVSDMADAMGTKIADSTTGGMKDALNTEFPGINGDREKALNVVADSWKRPTDGASPTFNKARAVVANNPEVPKIVAENGFDPYTHIDEEGKYMTADSADELRNRAAQISRDLLRPSLQIADYSVPPRKVSDAIAKAIADVNKDTSVTAGDKKSIIAHINSEGDALMAAFPDGMKLENMHDQKITYARNGKYNPFGDNAGNMKAVGNRALGRALGGMVEDGAPKEIDVHGFNEKLQGMYQAADYLEALNGKKAPVSMLQHVIRGAAKFGGAGVAAHLGGGIFSEFAGYQVGKNIERILENMTTPMRAHYLRNLEQTNHAAFQQVQEYLHGKMYGDASQLRLPEGVPVPPGSVPMPMGGKDANLRPIDATGSLIHPPQEPVRAVPASPTPMTSPDRLLPESNTVYLPGEKRI